MHSPKRRRRRETRRDMMIAAGVFVAICAAAVAGLWMVGRSQAVGPFACAGFEFTRSEWKDSDPTARRAQARLMTRCNYLVGKTRQQVRRDLGAPEGDSSDNGRWRFFIGHRNDFLRLDNSGHLVVRFNDSGRVVRAALPEAGD